MLSLHSLFSERAAPTILCLGAHSDDIEIGAGATLLSIAERFPQAKISWQVFAGRGQREREARESAAHFCAGFAQRSIDVYEYRDGFFPFEAAAIKERFEEIRGRCDPDIVLTHYRNDRHQDHKVVSDLTWQTFRNHLVLEYEIPKYDGDLGIPNFFCPVSAETAARKIDALEKFFGTQRDKRWFTRSTFDAMLRLRGIECHSPSGLAEAFYARKLVAW